jgi:hypothetical protein
LFSSRSTVLFTNQFYLLTINWSWIFNVCLLRLPRFHHFPWANFPTKAQYPRQPNHLLWRFSRPDVSFSKLSSAVWFFEFYIKFLNILTFIELINLGNDFDW